MADGDDGDNIYEQQERAREAYRQRQLGEENKVVELRPGKRRQQPEDDGRGGDKPPKKFANVGGVLDEMLHNELLAGIVGYDTFSSRLMRLGQIPGYDDGTGDTPKQWDENDDTNLTAWFNKNGFPKAAIGMIRAAVSSVAARNKYSAAREYLESLPPWDKQARLSQFFTLACGVDLEGDFMAGIKYLTEVAQCMFTGIVARVMDPGCQHDLVIILEGDQGLRKSSLCRLLALKDEWFTDRLPKHLDRDAHDHLKGKLIVELSEIAILKGSRLEEVKGFLTTRDAQVRSAYARYETMFKRQGAFIGTTNSDNYLSDTTGNRRFIPIACTAIDLAWVRANIEQLYAEALHRYNSGKGWHLSPEAVAFAKGEQGTREEVDTWLEILENRVDRARSGAEARGEDYFAVPMQEIMLELVGTYDRQGQAEARRICTLMKKLGGKYGRPFGRNNRGYGFIFKTDPNL